MKALDLFCGAGGVSVGLQRAGFDVTGVDINPHPRHRGGRFVQADALTFSLEGFDFIWASPPCQAWTALKSLHAAREYPELISPIRERLKAQPAPWCIENVPGAPLGENGNLIMLCGTMFGLQTPDGAAEIRRHRLFETSWPICLRPACQHGHLSQDALMVAGKHPQTHRGRQATRVEGALSVTGHSYQTDAGRKAKRRVMSVTGATPQTNVVRNQVRQTYSIEDAKAAMGIDWMTMKGLSQAIPPAYAEFIGREAMALLAQRPA